jgi:hypothetical protein
MADAGVVDAIRMPAPAQAVLARFRALPSLAQVFIALALVDAIARTIGILEPQVVFDGDGIALFTSFVPRTAFILLPAAVVVRRPGAAGDTPWVVGGAVLVALVTLLARPTVVLLGNFVPVDDFGSQVFLSVVARLFEGTAFVVLAIGLTVLNPKHPKPVVAGLGNLAALAVLLGAGLVVLAIFVSDATRIDVLDSRLPMSVSIAAAFAQLALAYLARAVVRGLDHPNRPEQATRLATAGVLMWALATLGNSVIYSIGTLAAVATPTWLGLALVLLEAVGGLLLVVAFAIGLADPLRPMAKAWEAAAAG